MTTRTPDEIRDISVIVYKQQLELSTGGGKGAVERMLAKDGDDGTKLRNRAGMYDHIVRGTLEAIGLDENNHTV